MAWTPDPSVPSTALNSAVTVVLYQPPAGYGGFRAMALMGGVLSYQKTCGSTLRLLWSTLPAASTNQI